MAVGEAASAVAGGEALALAVGEVAVFAADVDDLCVGVEVDWDDSRVAGVALGGVDADRCVLAFDAGGASAVVKVAGVDVEVDGAAGAQEYVVVDGGADADEFD